MIRTEKNVEFIFRDGTSAYLFIPYYKNKLRETAKGVEGDCFIYSHEDRTYSHYPRILKPITSWSSLDKLKKHLIKLVGANLLD